jgi:homogentisate 1,2-dioxygenase
MERSFSVLRGGTRVVFGRGASKRIGVEVTALGFARVLVVSTKGRAADAAGVAAALGDRSAGVLAIAEEHVPVAVADEGRRGAAAANADAVLAFGGGSSIGLAKAIALAGAARVIAIPTTYSGSEMTPIYGITEDGEKRTGRDERVRPALVVYDPDLTARLPEDVRVPSLWNALAHALETLWTEGIDRGTELAAEEALRLLSLALRDRSAREEALEGAYLAGAVFADVGSGIHHRLCHQLGGAFGLPHAKTHAVLLPHVARWRLGASPEAAARVARALGVVDPARGIATLARGSGAPISLAELGMPREGIERFGTTPELRQVLEAAWRPEGERTAARAPAPALRAPVELPTLGGLGSTHESEALEGALPRTQNAPRRCPYGLYPELLNGTPFTVESADNARVWMYRIRPSFSQTPFVPLPHGRFAAPFDDVLPNRTRWSPQPIPPAASSVDFLDGLATLGGAGDPTSGAGWAVHLYAANADMVDRCFSDADGDLLVVPQEGTLECRTELGWLRVAPGSVLLVPRALKHAIALPEGRGRGWVLEVWGRRLRLPERGLIGSNGLADARHFRAPVASFEDRLCPDGFQHVTKLGGRLFAATHGHSPFDVVAWHGNHAPFSYDLSLFSPLGATRFDHQDPSIFTVLTAPLDDHGRAICDFVVFPPRWEVIEHSFRPPFMHRNAASEINMVIRTPSATSGYEPGCTFLSPLLTAHGIATAGYDRILDAPEPHEDVPERIPDASLWAMFESALPFRTTAWARTSPTIDPSFLAQFEGMRARFEPTRR